MAFERSKAPSRCSHTDVELVGGFNASRAVLRSRCGLESNTVGDAVGHLNAWSKLGGRFIYDGLVSSPDRWGVKKLHQHRFRYEGMSTVGPAGDIRVFLLTTHVEPAEHTPSWIANCSKLNVRRTSHASPFASERSCIDLTSRSSIRTLMPLTLSRFVMVRRCQLSRRRYRRQHHRLRRPQQHRLRYHQQHRLRRPRWRPSRRQLPSRHSHRWSHAQNLETAMRARWEMVY